MLKFIKDWWNKIELQNQPLKIVYIPDVPIICKKCGGSGELHQLERPPTKHELQQANGFMGLACSGIPSYIVKCYECDGVGHLDNPRRQQMEIYKNILSDSELKIIEIKDKLYFCSNLIKNNYVYEFRIDVNSLTIKKGLIGYEDQRLAVKEYESILNCGYNKITPKEYKLIIMNITRIV